MALNIDELPDPDFPGTVLYRITCPVCRHTFTNNSMKAVKNNYLNHRQTHNGDRKE